ncbi:lysophosphatidic acid receptor 6 isoform X3 [Mobula hypostoma]|uniref:lysophosphatidic acid receptor 6 isoform X3 n=2 Tax=Mobula hypostoma TaxID=723540 RepID=UPI002FC276A8
MASWTERYKSDVSCLATHQRGTCRAAPGIGRPDPAAPATDALGQRPGGLEGGAGRPGRSERLSGSPRPARMNHNCSGIRKWSDPLYAAAFSFIFVIGLLLNTLALIFFFRFTKIRSQTTIYMKNLACADLLLLISLPMRFTFYFTRPYFSPLVCELNGIVFLVNMYASIFFLTCISLDRCVAICFPMKSRLNSLRSCATCYSVGVWLLVVGASLPPYLHLKLKNMSNASSCSSNFSCFEQQPKFITQPATMAVTLLLGCGVPLATIVICSLALIRALQRSPASRMDCVDWRRIRNMVLANVLIFAVCFVPYHVVLLLLGLAGDKRTLINVYLATIPLACLNTVLDPLCYYFATETFQRSLGVRALRGALTSNTESEGQHHRSRVKT